MLKKFKIEQFNELKMKNNVIICSYYMDGYGKLYTSMLNKYLKDKKIDVIYLEPVDYFKLFTLKRIVLPIFDFYHDGLLIYKETGFKKIDDIFCHFEQISA